MFGFSKFWETKNEQTPAQQNSNQPNANGTTSATTEARQQAAGSEQIAIGAQNSKENPSTETYGDLWKLSEEQQKKQNQTFEAFGADVTPEKIIEAARQVDFTNSIPKEVMEKILAGDQTALMQAINNVGQSAYAQSAMTSVNAAKQVAEKQDAHWQAKLPELVRELTQRNELSENNPLANDPATKPMYDMMLAQFQKKYPEATADQLKAHTTQYLNQFITKAGGKLPEPAKEDKETKIPQTISGDDSWNNFFN